MPIDENEIPINYTKEAFLQPVNLGSLLAFTILGFVSGSVGFPVALLLTLICAIELLYLGVVPKLPRFKKIIKLRKLSERNPELDEKNIFHQLDENSKRQYLVLRRLVKQTKGNFDSMPYTSQGLLDNIRQKIEKLLTDYLTLLDLHKRYQVYINSNLEGRLINEVTKEEKSIKKLESKKLRQTKQRRINILKKRLKKFEIAKEKYLVSETHLETIEDAVRFIYEQSMTMSDPEEIGTQLDNLLMEMEETSSIINDLESVPYMNSNEMEEQKLDIELEKANQEKQTSRKKVKE